MDSIPAARLLFRERSDYTIVRTPTLLPRLQISHPMCCAHTRGWALQAFGTIAGMIGQAERAARLLGAEEALRDEDGYKIVVVMRDQ